MPWIATPEPFHTLADLPDDEHAEKELITVDYRELADRLASFPWVPVSDADHRRALEFQVLLAARAEHRALSLVDGLVAASAEARDLVALHYDADFERLGELAGLAHQWVVPRGEAD